MKPQLTVIEGGMMSRHRREQKALDRARELGVKVEKIDGEQYLVPPPEDPEFVLGYTLRGLERFIRYEENRDSRGAR